MSFGEAVENACADALGGADVGLEAGADGVGNVGVAGVEEKDFGGWFEGEDGLLMRAGHGEDEVGIADDGGRELAGTVRARRGRDAELCECLGTFGRCEVAIDRGSSSGGDTDEHRRERGLVQHVLGDGFGHWAAAGVAGADEEDVCFHGTIDLVGFDRAGL